MFGSMSRRALLRVALPLVGVAVAVAPLTATPASAVGKSTTNACSAYASWTGVGGASQAHSQACIRWNGGTQMYASGYEGVARGSVCNQFFLGACVGSYVADSATYGAQQVDLYDATTGGHVGLHACAPASYTDFNNQNAGTDPGGANRPTTIQGPEYSYYVANCQVTGGTGGHSYYAVNRSRFTVNGGDYWGVFAQSPTMGPF